MSPTLDVLSIFEYSSIVYLALNEDSQCNWNCVEICSKDHYHTSWPAFKSSCFYKQYSCTYTSIHSKRARQKCQVVHDLTVNKPTCRCCWMQHVGQDFLRRPASVESPLRYSGQYQERYLFRIKLRRTHSALWVPIPRKRYTPRTDPLRSTKSSSRICLLLQSTQFRIPAIFPR
jgi:hypothetical protein